MKKSERSASTPSSNEFVALDDEGRPQFYELLRHRSEACFVVFDITELNGRDLKHLPLIERKSILRKRVRSGGRILVADHIDGAGVGLYRQVCNRDLEGIVAKWKHGRYVTGEEQPPDRALRQHLNNPQSAAMLTWLKIKNREYSQAEGRGELLFRRDGA